MLISVVVPASRAQGTIARAVGSLLAQTLAGLGSHCGQRRWRRLRSAAAPHPASAMNACASSRPAASAPAAIMRAMSGLPRRAANLSPRSTPTTCFCRRGWKGCSRWRQASRRRGDNMRVVADATGAELYRAFSRRPGPAHARHRRPARPDRAVVSAGRPRPCRAAPEGIEFGEDFVANLRLIERRGPIAVSRLPVRISRGRRLALPWRRVGGQFRAQLWRSDRASRKRRPPRPVAGNRRDCPPRADPQTRFQPRLRGGAGARARPRLSDLRRARNKPPHRPLTPRGTEPGARPVKILQFIALVLPALSREK